MSEAAKQNPRGGGGREWGRGTHGPTHVPGADEDGDHVRLWLLRVLVLHLLEKLAEAFSLLGIEVQTDSERPLPPCTLHFQRAWSASRKLRAAQISTNLQESNLERGSEVLRRWGFSLALPLLYKDLTLRITRNRTKTQLYHRDNTEKTRNNLYAPS